MKAEHLLFQIAIATFFICSLSLGGLDQSGSLGTVNMTESEFSAMIPSSELQDSVVDTGAPDSAPATIVEGDPGLAVYSEQSPSVADQNKLLPSTVVASPPSSMYYNGNYLAWSDFIATFPGSSPGLWIERAAGWSFYAVLPWGTWARNLIYVPQTSPVTLYESYPGGFVRGYNLGVVSPGYYYIWYYADSPGRHSSFMSTISGYSNAVIIDVYAKRIVKPNPPQPDPKKDCEKNPLCHWTNGQCNCNPAPNPVAECEKNPLCHWANGQCLCTGWDDPEKAECKANPFCSWVNGQCYCRGLNPKPEPEPDPFNPAPNPVAECQDNGCVWSNGRCNCMGLLGGDTGYTI